MPIKYSLFFLIGFAILFSSCQKQEEIPQKELYRTIYRSMLDTLQMECTPSFAKNWFRGIVAGQQTCYFGGRGGREAVFAFLDETDTEVLGIEADTLLVGTKKRLVWSIRHQPLQHGKPYIEIHFPEYPAEQNFHQYWDSLVNKQWKVASHPDERDKFRIDLKIPNTELSSQGGGVVFTLSSVFGSQEDSDITLSFAAYQTFPTGINRYIGFTVNCALYHAPGYSDGETEPWGLVEDAKFDALFWVPD
ncbi:MAG: hypothetical protein R2795_23970 [Saprospiraceae bacterium]